MFQYAYARNLQEHVREKVLIEKDSQFCNSEFGGSDYEREFGLNKLNISLEIADNHIGKQWVTHPYYIISDQGFKYQYKEEMLCHIKDNTFIAGHFFNLKYYEDIRDTLLLEFRPKESLRLDIETRRLLSHPETVSVHIRRGDYTRLKTCLSYDRYYVRAIRYIREKLNDPFFIIFTDDCGWVEKNINIRGSYLLSRKKWKDYEELQLMAMCRHNVIANSTFSYWGAWMNQNIDKIVVAPKDWMPSILPKDWIQV